MEGKDDICAICHEDFSGDLYTLPECSHIFHTHCIMTWFRMKKTTCPLCNNSGVNSSNDTGTIPWDSRNKALMNFKKIKAFSRRKVASKSLKKEIAAIKKGDDKRKQFIKELNEFKKSTPGDMTVRSIIAKYDKMWRKTLIIRKSINRRKILVGLTYNNITNIIIPIKKTF